MKIEAYRNIHRFADDLGGVFTLPDLRVALDENTEVTLFRRIASLVEEGELIKAMRGLYVVPSASLDAISARIDPTSYISTGTVLASVAAVGAVPVRKIQAVKVGRPRVYKCSLGVIEHLSISPRLFFGYLSREGRRYATPEKAFLDVCYYSFKGKRFSFDPPSDISTDQLDRGLIAKYLENYDRRFKTYYERMWGPTQ